MNIESTANKKLQIEDYAITGNYDLDDIVLALDETIEALKGDTNVVESRSQIYGAPSIMVASDFNGQTLVALKEDFFKNIYATTENDCNELWGDDQILCEGMINILKRAKAIGIPSNEVWLGDIIFFEPNLRKEKLFGENYFTFTPDEIKYLIAEKDPIGDKVNESKVGIAWRASYTGSTIESLNLHLDTTLSRIHYVPEIFQIDGDMVNITGRSTLTKEETKDVENTLEKLSSRREFIINHESYAAMRLSKHFSNELIKFKNHILDTENSEKWKYFNARGFKSYENALFEESKVKALGGLKQKIIEEKRLEFVRMVNKNKDLLDAIFYVQKEIIQLKDFLKEKISKMGIYKDIRGYIDQGLLPATYEETAIISHGPDTNIIVSAIPFNSCNATRELIGDWFKETPKLLEAVSLYTKAPEAGRVINDILNQSGVDIKKDFTNSQTFNMNIMPKPGVDRKDADVNFQLKIGENPNVIDSTFKFEENGRRLVANISFVIPNDELGRVYRSKVTMKPRKEKGMDAEKTKAMEELHINYLDYLRKNGIGSMDLLSKRVRECNLAVDWTDSIIRASNSILGYLNNEDYTYSREEAVTSPDGKKYESIHKLIIDVFKNKKVFTKGSARDSWNPSDIYACATRVYDEFKQRWEDLTKSDVVTLEDLNSLLKEYLDAKTVVGISLKKTNEKVVVDPLGYDPDRPERNYSFDIIDKSNIIMTNLSVTYGPRGEDIKGTSFTTRHVDENLNDVYTRWDYRPFPGMALETTGVTAEGKTNNAHNGKCEKAVLKTYLGKYSLIGSDTWTDMKKYLGKLCEDGIGARMVNNIENSSFNIICKDGTRLSVASWMEFAKKADTFVNNEELFRENYPEEAAENIDKKSGEENILYILSIVNFYNMIVNAEKEGANSFNNLITDLYLSSKHDSNFNAPYIKVQ